MAENRKKQKLFKNGHNYTKINLEMTYLLPYLRGELRIGCFVKKRAVSYFKEALG
jgi:hypothetical protein